MTSVTHLKWFLTEEEVPYEGQRVLFTRDGSWFYYGIYSEEKGRKAFYNFPEPDIDFIIDDVWAWAYVEYPEDFSRYA